MWLFDTVIRDHQSTAFSGSVGIIDIWSGASSFVRERDTLRDTWENKSRGHRLSFVKLHEIVSKSSKIDHCKKINSNTTNLPISQAASQSMNKSRVVLSVEGVTKQRSRGNPGFEPPHNQSQRSLSSSSAGWLITFLFFSFFLFFSSFHLHIFSFILLSILSSLACLFFFLSFFWLSFLKKIA